VPQGTNDRDRTHRDDLGTACGQPAAAQLVEIEPTMLSGYHIHRCPFIDTLLAGPQAPG
jgi:hypothetical protein